MIIVLEGFHLNPQHPQDVHGLAASRFPTQKPDISTSSPLFPGEPPGWWLTYPSEKYESQLGWWNSQYDGKNKTCSKPPTSLPISFHGLSPQIFMGITVASWKVAGMQRLCASQGGPLLLVVHGVFGCEDLLGLPKKTTSHGSMAGNGQILKGKMVPSDNLT